MALPKRQSQYGYQPEAFAPHVDDPQAEQDAGTLQEVVELARTRDRLAADQATVLRALARRLSGLSGRVPAAELAGAAGLTVEAMELAISEYRRT